MSGEVTERCPFYSVEHLKSFSPDTLANKRDSVTTQCLQGFLSCSMRDGKRDGVTRRDVGKAENRTT